jgi:hypothetical protein
MFIFNVPCSQNNKCVFRLSKFWDLVNLTQLRVSEGQSPALVQVLDRNTKCAQTTKNMAKTNDPNGRSDLWSLALLTALYRLHTYAASNGGTVLIHFKESRRKLAWPNLCIHDMKRTICLEELRKFMTALSCDCRSRCHSNPDLPIKNKS